MINIFVGAKTRSVKNLWGAKSLFQRRVGIFDNLKQKSTVSHILLFLTNCQKTVYAMKGDCSFETLVYLRAKNEK